MKKLLLLILLLFLAGCSNLGGRTAVDVLNVVGGIIEPVNIANDFMVGSTATTTADLYIDVSKSQSYFNSNALFGSYILGKDNLAQTVINLPSSGADNTIVSGDYQIGGSSVLAMYGQANGSGGADTLRVGIGTTTPLSKLTVIDTLTTSPRGILSMQFSGDTNAARVELYKARGTPTAKTVVVTGDMLGRVMFGGYDGSTYLEMASLDAGVSGTVAANRVPTYLAFNTATDAATSVLTERMRIDNAGKVGIGTTTPNSVFQVTNTATTTTEFGSDSSTACPSFWYIGVKYYIDFTQAAAGTLRNFATSTKPGYCI